MSDIEEFIEFVEYSRRPRNAGPRRYLRDYSDPFTEYSVVEFHSRYRFTPHVVKNTLLPMVEEDLRRPTMRGLPFPPEIMILVTLRFYATGSFQKLDGDTLTICQQSVSRIVANVSRLFAGKMKDVVKFPSTADQINSLKQNFYEIAGFPGVIGCIDCTHIKIRSPGGSTSEVYRNRKGWFSINVQAIAGPHLELLDLVARWPGSSHDSFIYNSSAIKQRLETGMLQGVLLGDSGYAVSNVLMTPFLSPSTNSQEEYNKSQIRTRNTVERLFGVWKRMFPCLQVGMGIKLNTAVAVICACATLYNIAKAVDDVGMEVYTEEDIDAESDDMTVLQRDVECHGRIVSSVVRLCGGGDAARALERRWHLLYLRAIEWQCHLEACLARIDNQSVDLVETVSDSDDEPALKLPRLSRRSSSRSSYTKPQNVKSVAETKDWQSSESDCDSEQDNSMADNRLVPGACTVQMRPTDQTVPGADLLDGPDTHMTLNHNKEKSPYNNPATPPTVIKRKKPVDSSKFNQTDRKSKNYATFYFKHNDTDSDRQMLENDRKSQEESSEEEWTYVGGPTIANEDSTDLMTSSVEIQCDLPLDKPEFPKMDLGYSTPDLLRDQTTRCKDIERLVIQAEELVQQQAQHQIAKMKGLRPLTFDEQGKSVTHAKISRIKEWLNQNSDDKMSMGNEGYDASGEYTTESEMENTMTPEERNLHSSMDMSTSTTVTPTHHAKVQIRTKRSNSNARPWSMSCMSQLSGAGTCLAVMPTTPDGATILHSMSISESALNTLSNPSVTPANSNSKLRGSSTTVKGHVSSTNTMTEACTSCVEANDRQCWLRRKRLKLRRHEGARRERLVKSLSFCGRLSPEWERSERSAASDPSTRKTRFYTRSSSSNDSDKDMMKKQLATIAYLRRSIEQTHISSREPDGAIPEQNENLVCPSFKLGPAGGAVRPRIARSMEHERILLGLSLGDPDRLWDLADKDSDIEKSVTAGTEEHSSFSEQAWDFYQEKYSSEPYSEAPDTDAARRLLEFGDDYRAFLDSQSDCCSSLSAQREPSPGRRRRRATDTLKHRRMSGVVSSTRKPKKSMSSAERKKSLLDSLERSRNNTSLESNEGTRRRKPSESDRKTKRCLETELPSRRRHNSNLTSDEVNSSLEYTEVNNLSNNLDSLGRRRRVGCEGESELELVALSELRRRSAESGDSGSSSPRRARRGDSDSEGEEVRALLRRSNTQLDSTEAALRHDLHHAIDYTEIVARCLENVNLLNAALAGGELCPMLQRDVRAVSARWSALRLAAARRSSARRLRREVASIRATLNEVIEPDDCAPQPHTKNQLNRRMEELKERLFKLLQIKVSMLKLTVSVRRALGGTDADDGGLTAELTGLLAAWDDAHQRTFDELVSLEKVVCAWAEWENGLRELQGALVGDLATLQALKKRGNAPQDSEVAAKIRQLAALLVDKKSGSTCDSLSDSGISDGDSEAAGGRARRLSALRELARRLQAALAPGSPAHRAIAKRMEQTENEVRSLQESCRALVEQSIPDFKADDTKKRIKAVAGSNTGSGDPEYSGRGSWVLRVLRSSLPIQLCLVALLLTAWLVERPRCCHALNSLGQSLTPQLRYVRGPPPV